MHTFVSCRGPSLRVRQLYQFINETMPLFLLCYSITDPDNGKSLVSKLASQRNRQRSHYLGVFAQLLEL